MLVSRVRAVLATGSTGLLAGQRAHADLPSTAAGLGVLLLFAYAMTRVGPPPFPGAGYAGPPCPEPVQGSVTHCPEPGPGVSGAGS
ncbi:hypothetical protein E1292_43155 [Nonomuraea deserti]|uniref:Uncharacterized protein n=1 Tax=Nonomuraea deserti TaxID=1848322 RepID=A0A4R4UGV8_9ACTN|nr:hypothetical protein [Nonomuraea deserti]TDC90911.1 hypothetical protein E1292_43155 [Nonomuraea deserti]